MPLSKHKKGKHSSGSRSEIMGLDYPILKGPPTLFDYKDAATLKPFLSETFKVLSPHSRFMSAKRQRQLSREIKRARFLALLPFTDQHSLL